MSFTQGQAVTQILPNPIQGTVEGFSLDQSNGEVLVLVVYKDEEGNSQSRYFKQSELIAE
jgi:hypothetical protein